MDPLLCLWMPAATRRNDMQMRIGASIPAVGLDHDDIAAFEGSATDPAEDIIQASHPTTHERTQYRLGLLIKRFPEHLGHQVIIVASIIARIDVLKAVPVVGKNLFEDAPGWRRGCSHQAASLRSIRVWIVTLLYHV